MRIHNEELEGGKQHKAVVHGGGGKREVEVHHLSSTTCKVCYREFPSKKSMFGHMRCHPERERRGINPPPSYPLPPPPPPPPSPPLKNSSSSTPSETTLAQTNSGKEHGLRSQDGTSLMNWPVTAHRARHPSSPMSLFDSAVEALCMLRRGENLNNRKGEEEDVDDYSSNSIAALYESGNESNDNSKIDKFEIRPCRVEWNQNQMSKKKVSKKRKLSALACEVCEKAFPSGRALGGHKKRHWVNPASLSSASPEEKKAAGAGGRVMELDLNEPTPME